MARHQEAHRPRRHYILYAIPFIVVYMLIFQRNWLVYLVLLAGSALLQHTKYKEFPTFDLGHVFFIAFMIDAHDGMAGEILFILLAGLLPEIMAGYFEPKTLFKYPLMIGVISLTYLLSSLPLAASGVIAATIYYFLVMLVSTYTREPLHERILETALPYILNLVYFINFSGLFFRLLDIVL